MTTPQLYDSPGNYDFIWIGDDGTYDGLDANLWLRKTENSYNAHEWDSITLVSTNKTS